MDIEVAYATPDKQEIVSVEVAAGTSVFDAVVQSRIVDVFPEIDPDAIDMGIFGKVVKLPKSHELRDGDRIELYRPLKIDPKQARLNRAKKKPA
ncbi:RnfH family protein [Marinobacter caseinilyticus]|uniref:RnfH family protein n=1 Tax=Marinobacter caseinilyticus TaxID=2692195 RepID=UPI00140E8830|nr:RnfH family protein [Marinobacter caseinilyticus]